MHATSIYWTIRDDHYVDAYKKLYEILVTM